MLLSAISSTAGAGAQCLAWQLTEAPCSLVKALNAPTACVCVACCVPASVCLVGSYLGDRAVVWWALLLVQAQRTHTHTPMHNQGAVCSVCPCSGGICYVVGCGDGWQTMLPSLHEGIKCMLYFLVCSWAAICRQSVSITLATLGHQATAGSFRAAHVCMCQVSAVSTWEHVEHLPGCRLVTMPLKWRRGCVGPHAVPPNMCKHFVHLAHACHSCNSATAGD